MAGGVRVRPRRRGDLGAVIRAILLDPEARARAEAWVMRLPEPAEPFVDPARIDEEAGRIRDEIKRLQATELAIADDPFARQEAVEDAAAEATARKRPQRDASSSPEAPKPSSRGGRPGSKPSRGRRR